MKLPSNILSKLCLTGAVLAAGCESAASLSEAQEPQTPAPVVVETTEPTFAQPPPAAAPRVAPAPAPQPKPVVKKQAPKPEPVHAHACGPCGMG